MSYPVPAASPRRGYLYVIAAALLWGVSGSAAKFVFQTGLSPFQLVQLRLTIAASVLLAGLLSTCPQRLKISSRDIGYFLLLGGGAMAAVQFTYLFAISKIQVAAAILLQYLAPAFVALYTAVISRERLGRTTLLALAGAMIGCSLVVRAYDLDLLALNVAGVLSGIASALAFAWYSLQGEYGMRRYDPWTVLFFAMFFGAVVWNILQPPFSAFSARYSPMQWVWIGYISVLGTLLPFGLYFKGINLIRSTRASITAILEPIAAGMLSFVFLHEIMTPAQIAGALLVMAAVVLLQLRQETDQNAPEAIRMRKGSESR